MIDVSTSGFGIDITTAEFIFDGETLSAAVKSMEYSKKNEEEMVHFQGSQNPQERTAGQNTYEASMVWGMKQYLLMCSRFGGDEALSNREFTLVVNASPRNENKFYQYTFRKLRMKAHGGNFDKSPSEAKVECSFFALEVQPVQDTDAAVIT